MTIWDNIYKNFQEGGPAWASLGDSLHPDFVDFIEGVDFETRNALDIGCGDGRYLLFLLQKSFRITGLDSSPTAISMATENTAGAGQLLLADMYEYAYPAGAYDLVISHAAMHHGFKAQVIALVGKIHSLLTADGRIFVSLPNVEAKTKWATMEEHEVLPDGTCLPTRGPEKGLPHAFFSAEEIEALFAPRYRDLAVKLDGRGRWIITGQKRHATA